MSAPKKISVYFFLLLVAVPLFFAVSFLIKQRQIQSQMMEQIEQAQLQTISIPLANITWVTQDKEIIIDGKLFDVKSYTVTSDTITLNGLFDGDEDNLVAKMNYVLHSKKDESSPLSQLVAKYLSQPLFNKSVSFSIQKTWVFIPGTFLSYIEPTAEAHCFLAVPPPKFS
jgi:hypothetical protein